ncbi:hypothetical protein ACFL47_03070 [Candidatus Latescibacterota bacterium]
MKQNLYIYLLALFAMCWGAAGSAAAPSGDVTVEIAQSNTQPAIGDSLTIFCTVRRPAGATATEPYPASKSFLVDIRKQWQRSENTATGDIIDRYGYLTYVFQPDTLQVGPFKVDVTGENGETSSTESNTLTFIVAGLVTDVEAPPKPNRSPFGVAARGLPLWAIILIIVGIIAVVAIIIYLLRRKKQEPVIERARPIDELGEFERIKAMKLHETGQFKELYSFTSTALRGFLHRNMGFDAMYDTTEEILYNLDRKSRDTEVNTAIRNIFTESDMVKFAKYIPTGDRSSTLVDRTLTPVRKVLEEIEREKARIAAEQASREKEHASLIEEHVKEQTGQSKEGVS